MKETKARLASLRKIEEDAMSLLDKAAAWKLGNEIGYTEYEQATLKYWQGKIAVWLPSLLEEIAIMKGPEGEKNKMKTNHELICDSFSDSGFCASLAQDVKVLEAASLAWALLLANPKGGKFTKEETKMIEMVLQSVEQALALVQASPACTLARQTAAQAL